MILKFEIKESILILDIKFENEHEQTLKLTTAPIPFRIKDLYVQEGKANYGKVNGQRKKIFVLPKHIGTQIPHMVGKTAIKLEDGIIEVGIPLTTEAELETWWKATLLQIRSGKNQQRTMSSEIQHYEAAETQVNLQAQGGGRSRTRIIFDD